MYSSFDKSVFELVLAYSGTKLATLPDIPRGVEDKPERLLGWVDAARVLRKAYAVSEKQQFHKYHT